MSEEILAWIKLIKGGLIRGHDASKGLNKLYTRGHMRSLTFNGV
jgi:hypothetical protein